MSTLMECGVCWYGYDPDAGDGEAEIPAGTAFEDLPESWTCPRCAAAKARFVRPPDADHGRNTDDERAVRELVHAFEIVERRMRELPICNPALRVEAVGFRRSGARVVGVLVTPWFLNVVVLDAEGEAAEPASISFTFPGGTFSFERGCEGPPHRALALLSPVHELADQEAARAVALETLAVLFDDRREPRAESAPAPAVSRRALFSSFLGGGR